jgi:hypothetical protein
VALRAPDARELLAAALDRERAARSFQRARRRGEEPLEVGLRISLASLYRKLAMLIMACMIPG